MLAAAAGHSDLVEALLDADADIDAQNNVGDTTTLYYFAVVKLMDLACVYYSSGGQHSW